VTDLTEAEKRVVREALWRYQSFCYARANEIAQDRSGKTKAEWVGQAQEEGKIAGDILLRLPVRVSEGEK
jgi:hypothetical protein